MILVLTTFPDRKSAVKAARDIVKAKLAACVNVIKIESSVYEWKGEMKEGDEFLLIIKGAARHYPALEKLIAKDHPYSLPEIIKVKADGGFGKYLGWVEHPHAFHSRRA
jgi:periplasmic divalent cation tolerance protein